MGKPTGFMEFPRTLAPDREPRLRVLDWKEFHEHMHRARTCRNKAPAAWIAACRFATVIKLAAAR